MRVRQAQLKMVLVEQHGRDFSVEQFVQWLLDLDDADIDEVGEVLTEESRRAVALADGYYERVTQRVAVLHPQMLAAIAFVQGATFAAAALGRDPTKTEP